MLSDVEIIEGCSRHERKAQQMLYDRYSRLLLGVCMRYASDKAEAEDMLQETFLKIFFNIKDYSGTGSFIGWIRKIAVNTAITSYHKNLKHRYNIDIEEYVSIETGAESFEEDMFTADELIRVLNELSPGYRMVFNLYAIEGYKHKEISEMLGIDINTSKSQYSRAKAAIRERLEILRTIKKNYPASENNNNK
ncbi:MAG TPA: sigma-70 family RNA polymerase sigma factor [Bacteroidales bacterium]|nr:sigma-70 family RNA polymerase sigma factor [Bacteroidales bacterium]HOU95889.1 sigma-70 family RNA polymerase sigma factor [Bacteroidales bacterium]HQG35882.1 sigma-70 family RNA polymerase sigma factor [Bacteroidales bacterium]HQG52392.1 sigma-70 family RNA polymerase sigma factor [Bacteroidales bacterium]HQJ20109.1 sigma-70 family RNA polymerase sigma factor [Bacteroidales bacterium]